MKESLVSRSTFECLVVEPALVGVPRMALAATRAGAIGILDFTFSAPENLTASVISDRIKYLFEQKPAQAGAGVRVSPACCLQIVEELKLLGIDKFDVIFTETPTAAAIQGLNELDDVRVLVEIRSFESFLKLPSNFPLDGVIVCGNENGGIVGEESTFILLQRLVHEKRTRVYARGIGLHTAAGCKAIGACGIVLDDQLLLTEESPLPDDWKQHIAACTGQDTIILGQGTNRPCRVLNRPTFAGVAKLKEASEQIELGNSSAEIWANAIEKYVGWGPPSEAAWPIGQLVGLAETFSRRYGTVAKAIHAIGDASLKFPQLAKQQRALSPKSALAQSHGTLYPIVQGPMTRVSDRPEFAHAVANAGALPLIALALLRGSQSRPILEATQNLLGDSPWGVGILGFVPPELRREQLAEVLRVKPNVVLIAGGRADIARELEQEGIATYLHAPAPSLLRRFLKEGLHRFVFEGRECGGHVGPLCSFPLWESMIEILLEHTSSEELLKVHVLFAGGIHDACSTAFISAMASPLVARGIRIGVLIGTAYLFTKEAVESGAIVPRYQTEALACDKTVLLKSGVGHLVRAAETPFTVEFERQRQFLAKTGCTAEETKAELERLMVGRLRVATKGILRGEDNELIAADEQTQAKNGVYMIGQVAALRSSVCTIADLHRDVSEGAVKLLESDMNQENAMASDEKTEGIAIIGIGLLLPGAHTLSDFWRNILNGVCAIEEVPADRWDIHRTFDANMSARDKAYSRWGGFAKDIPFDPLQHRIPPNTMRSICTSQLLALELTRWALADAGYANRDFDRTNTGVILGTDESSLLSEQLRARTTLPHVLDHMNEEALKRLPEWTGETLPGVLSNVVAGRIANEFDLGGPNFIVNAACASSLLAIDLAVRELQSGRSNMVLTGGVDATQTPFFYVAFSKTQALSPRGVASVFDQSADGIVLSEGACIMVLKRLADAQRDRNRIYAVIRGTGASSDGKGRGITVPTVNGQRRAIQRALRDAQIEAQTIELYEAHGTGTPLGDRTEVDTLVQILREADAPAKLCAVGSIKSLIGHTKLSAGVIGTAKAALALYHKVLPAHFGIEKPINSLTDSTSPIYVLRHARPWLAPPDHPRRAAVSAFGFGGTNSHLILESSERFQDAPNGADDWPCELLLFSGKDEHDLLAQIALVRNALQNGAKPRMRDLAFTLAAQVENAPHGLRLSLVSSSVDDVSRDLPICEKVARGEHFALPPHISFSKVAAKQKDKIAFLFPGQGSQYLNMAREQVLFLPELREALEFSDRQLFDCYGCALSKYIFPPGAFTKQDEGEQQTSLSNTHNAQPAIGAISVGFADFLARLGIRPDMVAGHSYGELTALHVASVLSRQQFLTLSERRGRAMAQCCGNGGMLSVQASREQVHAILLEIEGASIANHNAPRQTVISGAAHILDTTVSKFAAAGIRTTKLSVAGAFHSPLMLPAAGPWNIAVDQAEFHGPKLPVYSNLDATPYPVELPAIRNRVREHLLRPVEFFAQTMRMYEEGARTFIEVGPGGVLRSLVDAILEDRPHVSVSLDPDHGRLWGMLSSLGKLAVSGSFMHPAALFNGRPVQKLLLDQLVEHTKPAPITPTTWFVNGSNVRPAETRASSSKPDETFSAEEKIDHFSQLQIAERESVPQSNSDSSVEAESKVHPELFAAYTSYQQNMAQFLKMQEKALNDFLAIAHSCHDCSPTPTLFEKSVTNLPEVKSELQSSDAPLNVFEETPQSGPLKASQLKQDSAQSLSSSFKAINNGKESTFTTVLIQEQEKISAESDANDSKGLLQELVTIVSEYTGYPTDMLGLDLDMESELGIDSLRRMEIAEACLARIVKQTDPNLSADVQDALIHARSLKQMLSALQRIIDQPSSGTAPVSSNLATEINNNPCKRSVPGGIVRPLNKVFETAMKGPILITQDELGIAAIVADKLRNKNLEIVLIPQSDMQDRNILKKILTKFTKFEAIIHLAAISQIQMPNSLEDWKLLTQVHTKSLFQLLNLLSTKRMPREVPLRVIAASSMGGCFGRQKWFGEGLPIGGANVGLLKSLTLEWPGTVTKNLDFNLTQDVTRIANTIVDELFHTDEDSEIGYPEGIRTVFTHYLSPHHIKTSRSNIQLDQDWVVLATGGARGITAEVLNKFLQPGMTVIATGRTQFIEYEPPPLAKARTASELRNYFIHNVSGEPGMVPQQIEIRVKKVERDREIRANLARMADMGINVIYRVCDMSNSSAVQSLLDEIYTTYGRIDAVIHGAGIIEDKLLSDKAWDSFDRVFDTKVDSTYLLACFLRHSTLKLLVFMGSISGRIGNIGQTDYAAANEVLNRFAWWLSERWTNTRIISINWGPWASRGMATAAVQTALKKRGIVPIDTEDGCKFLEEELIAGDKSQVEVLAGEGPWVQ